MGTLTRLGFYLMINQVTVGEKSVTKIDFFVTFPSIVYTSK
jgi:hypothetical protein